MACAFVQPPNTASTVKRRIFGKRDAYRAAYAAHYTGRDLPMALQLYRQVVASHPNALEAGYSRSQVENIVKAVVPTEEILDAQMKLALAHFQRVGASEAM